MIVAFAKTFMRLVRIGGENGWTLYDFDAVALCEMADCLLSCKKLITFGKCFLCLINTTVQRNYPIGSVDLNRNHSSDVLV